MKRKETGIALIIVLWVVFLLAVIAGSYAFEMRSESQLARNVVDSVRVRALAEAGVYRAILGLR
jgi:general secretion pathway protein K